MTTRLTTLTINELGAATAAAANAAAAASSAASAAEYGTKPSRLIDGDFNFWPEGAGPFTSNSEYGPVMWRLFENGGSSALSRQSNTLTDTFGLTLPEYFARLAVSGQSLSGHFCGLNHRIEGARTYAGQTITILGWAKTSAGSGDVGVSIEQDFGTGGSPSSRVRTAAGTFTPTGSWAPFAITVTVPTLSGKTLGSNGDDHFGVSFWLSDGGDFSASSGLSGVQTITVDFACIHIRQGTHDTGTTANYLGPDPSVEFPRTLRYFNKSYNLDTTPGATTNYVGAIYGEVEVTQSFAFLPHLRFPVPMRAAPTFTVYNPETGTAGEARNISGSANAAVGTLGGGETGFSLNINNVSVTAGNNVAYHYTADARL